MKTECHLSIKSFWKLTERSDEFKEQIAFWVCQYIGFGPVDVPVDSEILGKLNYIKLERDYLYSTIKKRTEIGR